MADDSREEAEAAGYLALRVLENFFSHQAALGAIEPGEAQQVWRHAAEQVAIDRPHLGAQVEALTLGLLTRLDQEEAARYE